uniref:Uncharacterized protein ALNC14_020910 n=1 Tax=Albugo laibachii Nc14 TaxID=890382 RepID=F0W4B5_9STRA|nr:unnamed protein product [Albugo laibachii Nc14]|eukprot:CCA15948.1 unnamed protein product [Albugo laibachii Nc14]
MVSDFLCAPLGVSIPPESTHSISVSLPKWDHVVEYEKGNRDIIDKLNGGYPRFVYHSYVKELTRLAKELFVANNKMLSSESLQILPTKKVAMRLYAFLTYTIVNSDSEEKLFDRVQLLSCERLTDLHAVSFPASLCNKAKASWQHCGEIVSSRHALALLNYMKQEVGSLSIAMHSTPIHHQLCQRIAQLYTQEPDLVVSPESVFVYPTGMAAIFAAVRLLKSYHDERQNGRRSKAILIGFPYVDTLKILEREEWCNDGVHFLPHVTKPSFYSELEKLLKEEEGSIFGIFTEFPGNPLLLGCNLDRISQLASKYNTYLVVDDTIGSYNVNVLQNKCADIIVTSLSKIFSGTATVMGGSLVLSPCKNKDAVSVWHHMLQTGKDAFVMVDDAQVLLETSASLQSRVNKVNASAHYIVERLQNSSFTENVYYPAFDENTRDTFVRYQSSARFTAQSFGSLISVQLKEEGDGRDPDGMHSNAHIFYDALEIAKGPSLGTNFTLSCPYTLLAHYTELDFAESCGVNRRLIRISIGLEKREDIWRVIANAFKAVRANAECKAEVGMAH